MGGCASSSDTDNDPLSYRFVPECFSEVSDVCLGCCRFSSYFLTSCYKLKAQDATLVKTCCSWSDVITPVITCVCGEGRLLYGMKRARLKIPIKLWRLPLRVTWRNFPSHVCRGGWLCLELSWVRQKEGIYEKSSFFLIEMLAKAFVMLITLFRRLIKVNILSWEKLKK